MEMIPFLCLFHFRVPRANYLDQKQSIWVISYAKVRWIEPQAPYAEDIGRPTTNLRHEQYCNHSKIGTLS